MTAVVESEPLLSLAGVDTYYGPIHILKTILGTAAPRQGIVSFAGEDVTRRPTNYRIRRGMAIVPDHRRLFAPMTVLEKPEIGACLRGRGEPEDYVLSMGRVVLQGDAAELAANSDLRKAYLGR